MTLGFSIIKNIGIIALFLLGSVGGCSSGVVEERDIVSTVDTKNVYEQYVVIHAGRDQGIKVGNKFTLSREHRVTSTVVVFEVADTICKARAYKGNTITMVRAGDEARLYVPTMIERSFPWLCTVIIGLVLAIKRRNGLIWLLGIIGLILQPMLMDIGGGSWIGWIGILFSIIGLSLYAKAKGRHGAWGLFGLFPVLGTLIGAIVILCLKDYSSAAS